MRIRNLIQNQANCCLRWFQARLSNPFLVWQRVEADVPVQVQVARLRRRGRARRGRRRRHRRVEGRWRLQWQIWHFVAGWQGRVVSWKQVAVCYWTERIWMSLTILSVVPWRENLYASTTVFLFSLTFCLTTYLISDPNLLRGFNFKVWITLGKGGDTVRESALEILLGLHCDFTISSVPNRINRLRCAQMSNGWSFSFLFCMKFF